MVLRFKIRVARKSTSAISKSREGNRASVAQLILSLLFLAGPTWSAEFVLLGQTHWDYKTIFEKTTFGGISAMVIDHNKLLLLSDDRGYVNEPRFYEMDIK